MRPFGRPLSRISARPVVRNSRARSHGQTQEERWVRTLDAKSSESIGARLLADARSPVVRYRVLRDVLRLRRNDARLLAARENAARSRWVNQLATEQRADGSWGRFHSADSALRRRVPTSEAAIGRAIDLGLDRSHPILRKAAAHVAAILRGDAQFPDPAEKNERWPAGVRLFCASTLAGIDPAAREV